MSDKNKHDDDEFFFDDEEFASLSEEKNESFTSDENSQDSAKGDDSEEFEPGFSTLPDDDAEEDDDEDGESGSSFLNSAKSLIMNNARISIVVGIAVVAIIGFALFSGSSKEQQFMQTKAQQTSPVIQKAAVSQAPVIVKQEVEQNISKKEVQSIKSDLRKSASQFLSFQQSFTSLKNEQQQANDRITQLLQEVQKMESNTQQLVSKVKVLEKYKQDQEKKRVYKKLNYVRYHIRGMEQGRAWIMGSNGLLATVVAGNSLPHYGKVDEIDVDHGVIVMSSGDNILYEKGS